MLEALRKLFTDDTPPKLTVEDARAAMAALMVRVARADGHFEAAERGMILSELQRLYGISAQEAETLCAEGEQFEAEAPDTHRFTLRVKEAVPYEARSGAVEALWRIALADGSRDAEEDGFLRLVVSLLGVSDPESALARQRAARRD